jgi:hypothetical protein
VSLKSTLVRRLVDFLIVEVAEFLGAQACGVYAAGCSVPMRSPGLFKELVVDRGASI